MALTSSTPRCIATGMQISRLTLRENSKVAFTLTVFCCAVPALPCSSCCWLGGQCHRRYSSHGPELTQGPDLPHIQITQHYRKRAEVAEYTTNIA
jgi:hypothetical protein